MVQRRGPRLTAAQKADVWRRWRQGESLTAIGRALGRIPKMVQYIVAGAGGIPPVPRQRARQALTLAEREVISRGVACGSSLRQISRDLGRAPSTVSREVRRHGPLHGCQIGGADQRDVAVHGGGVREGRAAVGGAGKGASGGVEGLHQIADDRCRREDPPEVRVAALDGAGDARGRPGRLRAGVKTR